MQGRMMMKAFLAWAGIMAIRAPVPRTEHGRCQAFHDEADREMAIFAGAQAVVRRSQRLANVMDSDPSNTPRISKGIDDMRETMAIVARRADR